MIKNLLLLNTLGPIDIIFFVVCAAIVVVIVAVYFLIPVFNKKQYQEQRENLKKREDAFKSNKKTTMELESESAVTVEENQVANEVSEVISDEATDGNCETDSSVDVE